MEFEWDPDKRQANLRKHGVDFAEAMTVFGDRLEKTIRDPGHSTGEERFMSHEPGRVGGGPAARGVLHRTVRRQDPHHRRSASHTERTERP